MAAHQINGFNYGNIKYKNSHGIVSNVRAIYYKDVIGSVLQIWPDQYWADNIIIRDLTTSQDISYSYDSVNNTPIYTRNGSVIAGLDPYHEYVIVGTIKRGSGQNFPDITGCYFDHVTNSGPNNLWYQGPGEVKNNNIINSFTGNAEYYTVYEADDRLTNNLEEAVVLAYDIPDAQMAGMTFIGYGYGSQNFENVTPIILKRCSIQADIMFFDDPSNITYTHRIDNGYSLSEGDSVIVWPKIRKYGGDTYEQYSAITGSWSGGTGNITVTDNNNGSYTITATQSSNTAVTLMFSCTVDGQNLTESLDLTVTSGVSYGVKIGNNGNYSFAAGNQSGTVSISELTPVNVVQSEDDGVNYSSYSGSFAITSGNSSIISVNGNNIVPVGTGQTTVTVTVNGASWIFTVNATYNVYMVYNIADSGNETFTNFNSNQTININSVGPHIIGFSSSSSEYDDAGPSITKRSGSIPGTASVQGTEINIYVSGSGSGSAIFDVTLANGSTYSVTVNVNVS